jgi:hypothetical protein
MPVLDHASNYLRAGLSVLPADAVGKRPAVASWKEYQDRLPTEDDVRAWFATDRALCLVAGAVSGNLEMIDFDCAGEKFAWWKQLVEHRAPGLLSRLVIERSPSGGWHVVYRCQTPPCGNIKLAERAVPVANDEEVEFYGRKYKPRDVDGRWEIWLTLIETRAEGGLFLCAPTPGYELTQGRFEELPLLSDQEREVLLEAAWSQNELRRQPEPVPDLPADPAAGGRPGDEYNARGDVRAVLRKHGWSLVRSGDNEYWRRPGKTAGWSATLKDGMFFVHSSSAAPFEPSRAYSAFTVYAKLEHAGDYTQAASALRQQGYGSNQLADDVDLSKFTVGGASAPTAKPQFEFKFITSRELAANEYKLEYLIEGVMVRGQPMIVAAPKKGLKTNTSVDMALALAEGGLYLGRFNVPRPVRVAMMSAESGEATIKETASRIAVAKYKRLSDFDNPIWAFQVPLLNSQAQIDALRRAVERHRIEVLILDPTYLMMVGIGEGASNLFLVGSFLQPLGALAQEFGVTIVMCHHLKKKIIDPYEPAELEDIAWAGFQEYVRQWILLNRRVRYNPALGGRHELWMSVGGSAGHSGLWGLNVDEGTLQDTGGRRWEVELISSDEAYELRAQVQDAAKEKRKKTQNATQLDDDCRHAVEVIGRFSGGETKNALRDACGFNTARFGRVLSRLLQDGFVEECEVAKSNGQAYPGIRVTRTLGLHSDSEASE